MEVENLYLLRRLEESSNYFGRSYSFRYNVWKRCQSIRRYFLTGLKKFGSQQPIRVLEVGCSDAWLTYWLKAEFSKIFNLIFLGIDLSYLDIDFACQRKRYFQHSGCYFQVMDAQRLGFKDNTFDIVIASELLEHILRPKIVIGEICRVLKKGGIFIATTPHKNSGLVARLLKIFRKPGKDYFASFIEDNERSKVRLASDQGKTGAGFGHISVKTKKEWVDILRKEGFAVELIQGTGGLFLGSPYLDRHRILFALSVILDVVLERLPFSYLWSELLIFQVKKC